MKYIITLNNVQQGNVESVGFRAVDLAFLREKRLNIPLSFVVNNLGFEAFIAENGLRLKAEKILIHKSSADAYPEIKELFMNAVFPRELEDELIEAYDSLSIDPSSSADSIISAINNPPVILIRSPSFMLATDDSEAIIQNVKGKDSFLSCLKEVWASMYSARTLEYKKKVNISGEYGLGVIVQKMKKITHSVIAYSKNDFDENTIILNSFIGLPDFNEKNKFKKDLHEVDVNSLLVKKIEVNIQEFALLPDVDSRTLVKKELKEEGFGQKINDKQISEIARFVKRAKSFLGKDIKVYLGVKALFTYILLVNRMTSSLKTEQEANQELRDALESNRLKEYDLKDEDEDEDASESEGNDFSSSESEIEKEEHLLSQVMKIKGIIERMESHALENNKEAYYQERSLLEQLLANARRNS